MEPFLYVTLLILFGILVGTVAVLAGIGGSVVGVPLMIIFLGVQEEIAIGTASLIIIMSSGFGFVLLRKQDRVNIKLCLICSIFTIIGSIISTIIFLFIQIDNYVIRIIFACVMIYVSINLIAKKDPTDKNEEEMPWISLKQVTNKETIKKGAPLFVLAGFLANLLGIGGGIINTPTLHYILQFPILYATSTSTGIVFFTAFYNFIAKWLLGEVDLLIGILMGSGGILGAIFGVKISQKISRRKLTLILAAILLLGSIRLIFP